MAVRCIVRPPGIITTPKLLKRVLGARRTISGDRQPSWFQDFFLYYPPIEELIEYGLTRPSSLSRQINNLRPEYTFRFGNDWVDGYRQIHAFCSSSKPAQRFRLHGYGFPIPPTFDRQSTAAGCSGPSYSGQYIVRPKRHRSGIGWRLTRSITDFNEQSEYIQELYPKNHEYRVIAIRGEPIVTLLKRVPENTPRASPWNHSCGSSFVTVHSDENNRLRHTNIYDLIRETPLFKHMDLIGVDVMYRRDGQYAVSEVNTCPALQIPSSIEKVARHVHNLLV